MSALRIMSQKPPELPPTDPDPFDDFINHELDFGADRPNPSSFGGSGPSMLPRLSSPVPMDFDTDDVEDDDDVTDSSPKPSTNPFGGPSMPRYGRLGSGTSSPFGSRGPFSTPPPSSSQPGKVFPSSSQGAFGRGLLGNIRQPVKTVPWWREREIVAMLVVALVFLVLLLADVLFPDLFLSSAESRLKELEVIIQTQSAQIQELQATLEAIQSKP